MLVERPKQKVVGEGEGRVSKYEGGDQLREISVYSETAVVDQSAP